LLCDDAAKTISKPHFHEIFIQASKIEDCTGISISRTSRSWPQEPLLCYKKYLLQEPWLEEPQLLEPRICREGGRVLPVHLTFIHYGILLMPSIGFLSQNWSHWHVCLQNKIMCCYMNLQQLTMSKMSPFVNSRRHMPVCIISVSCPLWTEVDCQEAF